MSWTSTSSACRSTSNGRLTGANLRATLDKVGADGLFAVVATAGTTNFGIVDDLGLGRRGLPRARACGSTSTAPTAEPGWPRPSVRHLYAGIEHADSFIVDPHKWFFAPFDCCALIYRDPALAKAAHTQKAGYLDVLTDASDWNPSDYSDRPDPPGPRAAVLVLPRRPTAARRTPPRSSAPSTVTRHAASEIKKRDYVELLREPDLSVVVFRRIGWTPQQYQVWSDRLLAANFAFVVPTTHEGETVTRFAIVNPQTSKSDINAILDTMA